MKLCCSSNSLVPAGILLPYHTSSQTRLHQTTAAARHARPDAQPGGCGHGSSLQGCHAACSHTSRPTGAWLFLCVLLLVGLCARHARPDAHPGGCGHGSSLQDCHAAYGHPCRPTGKLPCPRAFLAACNDRPLQLPDMPDVIRDLEAAAMAAVFRAVMLRTATPADPQASCCVFTNIQQHAASGPCSCQTCMT